MGEAAWSGTALLPLCVLLGWLTDTNNADLSTALYIQHVTRTLAHLDIILAQRGQRNVKCTQQLEKHSQWKSSAS